MSRAPAARLARALLAVGLAGAPLGCGERPPPLPPHGLFPPPLVAAPGGAPFGVGQSLVEGTWEAQVDVRLRVARTGRPDRPGLARFRVRQATTRAEDGTWQSDVDLHVMQREGPGADLVDGLDGLAYRVDHDAWGRPRPETIRFRTQAPPGVERLFEGFWLCGFGGARAWRPARPLVDGEVASRADLGGVGAALHVGAGLEVPAPQASGGVLVGRAGEDVDLRLATLVEVVGLARAEGRARPISLGILSEGRATLDVRTGLPRSWTLTETTRYAQHDGERIEQVEIREEVVGTVTAAPPAPAGDG